MEEFDDTLNSVPDESSRPVNELYTEGMEKAATAQDEAEQWADENNMETWSNGDSRVNHIGNTEDACSTEQNSEHPADGEESPENESEKPDDGEKSPEKESEQPADSEPSPEDGSEQQTEDEQPSEKDLENIKRAELEADVERTEADLYKKLQNIMFQKETAYNATVDAANVEDSERFKNLQYDLGCQIEELRFKIIENRKRLEN